MHFDLDKMPLGSISEVQIKHGYEALTKLADALQSPAADQAEQRHRLLTLTTHFYTIIPHKFDLDQVHLPLRYLPFCSVALRPAPLLGMSRCAGRLGRVSLRTRSARSLPSLEQLGAAVGEQRGPRAPLIAPCVASGESCNPRRRCTPTMCCRRLGCYVH